MRKNRVRAQSPPVSSSQSSVASSQLEGAGIPAAHRSARRQTKKAAVQLAAVVVSTKENTKIGNNKRSPTRKIMSTVAVATDETQAKEKEVTRDMSTAVKNVAKGAPEGAKKATPIKLAGKRSLVSMASPIAASPLPTSRAGRKNSPRIDYRTGQRLEDLQAGSPPPNSSSPSRRPLRTLEAAGQAVTPGRKRSNGQISGKRNSSSNSPTLKKKPTEVENGVGTRRSGRSLAAGVPGTTTSTYSEEDEIIAGTPPTPPGR